MKKLYRIKVRNDDVVISEVDMKELFTEKAQKLIKRVNRQGGEIHLGIGSLKPMFRPGYTQCADCGEFYNSDEMVCDYFDNIVCISCFFEMVEI
jgi:hypothetical protein